MSNRELYYRRSGASSNTKQIHEKNCPLKVGGNEGDKRPENICKKNVALSSLNSNIAQQDKNRETCPVHQGKTQSENEQKTETESTVENEERKDLNLEEHIIVSSNKTSKHLCSCACCMLESEQIENALKDLQSQTQELNAELNNFKTENQMLRKDINRAKNVVKRDIGRNVESFEDIVKKMTEDSWIGQQEKIVSLKKELRVLKDELRDKGLKPPSPVIRREFISPEKISNDRRVHWRLTLERRSILRQTERDKQDLIEDRDRVKERFDLMLNRNKSLEEQVEFIRQELKETRKGSNGNFISRLHEIEKKAKFCLDEKSRLRRAVEEEEMKEKQLLNKLKELKAEINSQKKTLEIAKESLSKKKSGENALLSSVTAFESEALSGLRDIDKSLNAVDEIDKKIVDRSNILIDLIFMFEELFSQLKQRTPLYNCSDDEISSSTSIYADTFNSESPERVEREKTSSTNEQVPTTTVKAIMEVNRESVPEDAETVMEDTKEKLERILTHDDQHRSTDESTKLKDEYDRFVTLWKHKQEEILKKSEHIYDLIEKNKEKTEEMLRINFQAWRTAWQLKTLSFKNKRLRKLVKNYANALLSQQHGFCHTTWDELINKGELVCNILGKENKFLKRLITNVAQSKAYDFDLYTFVCKRMRIPYKKSQQQINAHQQARIVYDSNSG